MRQIKIHMQGSEIFIPEQPDGQRRKYNDTDIHDSTIICGQIKYEWKSAQLVHLCMGN